MGLTVVTAPTIEPVSIDDLKIDLRIDADLTEHDVLIESLSMAARRWIERTARRALITQTLKLTLDDWPASDRLSIPRPPLLSIVSIKYYDTADGEATFSSGSYFVDTGNEPGRVVLNSGVSWPSVALRPASGVMIEYTAGYGPAEENVPSEYKNAIRLLVAHWYENPSAVSTSGAVPQEVPFGVMALLDRMAGF